MARVAGIDLPKNKRIDVALEYIYGIGKKNAKEVLAKVEGQIDPATRVKDLTEQQAGLLNTILQKEYKVEGELRREVNQQQNPPRTQKNGRFQSEINFNIGI